MKKFHITTAIAFTALGLGLSAGSAAATDGPTCYSYWNGQRLQRPCTAEEISQYEAQQQEMSNDETVTEEECFFEWNGIQLPRLCPEDEGAVSESDGPIIGDWDFEPITPTIPNLGITPGSGSSSPAEEPTEEGAPDVSGDVDESGSSVEPVDDAPAADDSTRDEGEVVETPVAQPVSEQAVVVQDQQSEAPVSSELPEATHSTSSNNSAVGVNAAAPEQPATTTNNEADVMSPVSLEENQGVQISTVSDNNVETNAISFQKIDTHLPSAQAVDYTGTPIGLESASATDVSTADNRNLVEADVYSPEALGADADTAEGGVFNLLLALGLLTLGAGGATALVVKTRRDRW
jgi:hypothetical protein